MKSRIILFFLALLGVSIHASTSNCTPSQIHLSFGDSYYSASGPINPDLNSSQVNNNQAYLVWQNPTVCQYVVVVNDVQTQQQILNQTADSTETISVTIPTDDGTTANISISYTVLLTNLSYGTTYSYTILDTNNVSLAGPFQFSLASPNLTSSSKIIVVGNLDLQQNNTMTLEAINEFLGEENETYAGIIQIGEIPYYLQNVSLSDEFNFSLPNFTATLPLLATPGRGEMLDNSSFFDFRIRNPLFDATENQYFSFNLQGIHFVSINLDYYNLTTTNQSLVYSWLENDLIAANSTAARELWPFIVVITSYPLYCTQPENATEATDCSTFFGQNEQLDDLFTNSNVDLVISGGLNAYQQLLPTDQDSTSQASQNSTLTDPNSTIYVIEGVGSSSQSGIRPGFGVVYALNNSSESRLVYEHYDSDTGDQVDSVTLVKTNNQGNTPTPTDNTTNPNNNTQNSGDNTSNPGDNTNTNTTDNTPNPGDNTNTNTTDNTPSPGDNTNTNTTDNNQNPNNGTQTDDEGLEGPTENPNATDPEEPESIVPKLIIPLVIILAIVLVAIYWKRRKTDPEMESLTIKEYKSNKIYNKRSTEASISMVDLVL